MIEKKQQNRICFIIQFRNWVVPRTSPCRVHFRMLLGRPWYISLTFMRKWRNSVFFLPVRMLKLYFKNVLVMNFMEDVNTDIWDILRKSKWRAHIGTWALKPFFSRSVTSLKRFSKTLCNIEAMFYLSFYIFTYISLCLTRLKKKRHRKAF